VELAPDGPGHLLAHGGAVGAQILELVAGLIERLALRLDRLAHRGETGRFHGHSPQPLSRRLVALAERLRREPCELDGRLLSVARLAADAMDEAGHDVATEASEHLRRRRDAQHALERVRDAGRLLADPAGDGRPHALDAALEAVDDLLARAVEPLARLGEQGLERLGELADVLADEVQLLDRALPELR